MFWVAIEDADTYEVSEFEEATADTVLDLMDGYRVKHVCERVCVRDVEDGKRVAYKGVIYRGGFGYNLWVTRKYLEL